MPGAPVRVRLGIGCFGEGAMNGVAVLGGGRAVNRGPDEWMRELDPRTHSQQTGVDCRFSCSHIDAECLGDTVEQHGIPKWLCGRGEDEQSRRGGKHAEATGSVRSC